MDQDFQTMAGGDELSGVSVHSGFPNPALDRSNEPGLTLDINRLLVKRPSSTYLFRIAGHQWSSQGICDGDIVVIDRAPQRQPEDLVITWQNDNFQLCRQRDLLGGEAWGVVTAVIHQLKQ